MPRQKRKGTTVEEAERLVSAARDETESNVKVLADLRDKSKSDTVRLHAASALLAYAWGKPPVMENVSDQANRLSDEELDEEYTLIQKGKSVLPSTKKAKK